MCHKQNSGFTTKKQLAPVVIGMFFTMLMSLR